MHDSKLVLSWSALLAAAVVGVVRPDSLLVTAALPAVAMVGVQLVVWIAATPETLPFAGFGISLTLLSAGGSRAALLVAASAAAFPFLARGRLTLEGALGHRRSIIPMVLLLVAWCVGTILADGFGETLSRAVFVMTAVFCVRGGMAMGSVRVLEAISRVLPVPVAISLYLQVGPALARDVGSRETKLMLNVAGPVNLLGAVVALCFLSNLVLIAAGSRRAIDFSSSALTVFLGGVLFSRTAIVAALAALLVLLVPILLSSKRAQRVYVSCATVLCIAVAFLPLLVEFINLNQLLRGRSYLWDAGSQIVRSNMTYGVGYSSIEGLKAPLIAQAEHASAGGGFHSLVIDSWLGAGIVGPMTIIALGLLAMRLSTSNDLGQGGLPQRAVWAIPFVYGIIRGFSESSGWLIDKNVNVLSSVLWVCVGAVLVESKPQTSAERSNFLNSAPQVRPRPSVTSS